MTPEEAERLALTRRILAETQAAIEKATRRRQRRRHKFTETQLRIARESLERQESIKEAGKAA